MYQDADSTTHYDLFFFFKPYPINVPSRAPTQDLDLLLGGRVVLTPCCLVVDRMPGNTIQQTAAATARVGEPSGDGVAVYGTHASGAQNSSTVHRTCPMCTEHQWCTELILCAQNSSARCTELVRCAQNSSAVHGTRQCCTEPTTAVHRTRWNPRSRCTSPRRDARDRPGPPGPSPTATAPPCTHHEPHGIQPIKYQFLTCTG